MRFLILLLVLSYPFITAGSEIYTWKDKKGFTHYSNRPPQGYKEKKYTITEKGITRFSDYPPPEYKGKQAEPTKSQPIEKFQSKNNTKEINIKPNFEDRRNSFNLILL